MNSPRQRPRRSPDVPVLFRLPNLRHRGDSASMPQKATSAALESSPAVSAVPVSATEPAAPVVKTAMPAPSKPRQVEPEPARGWMERIGSRVVLVVTLLIIVAVAWITGRQMPASKPAGMKDLELVEVDAGTPADQVSAEALLAAASSARSETETETMPETATEADTEDTTLNSATVAVQPAQTPSSQTLSASTESSTAVASVDGKSNPDGTTTESNLKPALSAAATDSPNVFNTVSLHSPTELLSALQSTEVQKGEPGAVSISPPANAQTPVIPELAPSSTLAVPALPAPATTSSTAAAKPAAPERQTTTPHEPALNPELLLSWYQQQANVNQPVATSTPHAVSDWSQYLPGGPSDPLRTAQQPAVNQGSSATPRQASLPPNVVTNPYSR